MSLNRSQHIQYARYYITHGGGQGVGGGGGGVGRWSHQLRPPNQARINQSQHKNRRQRHRNDRRCLSDRHVSGTKSSCRGGLTLGRWGATTGLETLRGGHWKFPGWPDGQNRRVCPSIPQSQHLGRPRGGGGGGRSCDWEVAGEATEKNLWFVHITTTRTLAA